MSGPGRVEPACSLCGAPASWPRQSAESSGCPDGSVCEVCRARGWTRRPDPEAASAWHARRDASEATILRVLTWAIGLVVALLIGLVLYFHGGTNP